jgi:hypothetical protein
VAILRVTRFSVYTKACAKSCSHMQLRRHLPFELAFKARWNPLVAGASAVCFQDDGFDCKERGG